MIKGTIALDIDGTITGKDHLIPDHVASYFTSLHQEGWQFIFITGRIFSFAMTTLTKLSFPFFLGVQNGADLLLMPETKPVSQTYFQGELISFLDDLYRDREGDFIIYSGFQKGDFCYYRPQNHSEQIRKYLDKLMTLCPEPWQPLDTFDKLKDQKFPLIKCFGLEQSCYQLQEELLAFGNLETSVIKDPMSPGLYLLLITDEKANKGSSVIHLVEKFNLPSPLIVGGDDLNDIPLLKVGDVTIAMEGAPTRLTRIADIVAPPASIGGIIDGIERAIKGIDL
jgi:hydroxymethylpyrimidine pyrophosphatase-like HAD family hydrolase